MTNSAGRSAATCRSPALTPNERMQPTGRCGAEAPWHVGMSVAAMEALVCAPRAVTARS
jgi:hypothetical protein